MAGPGNRSIVARVFRGGAGRAVVGPSRSSLVAMQNDAETTEPEAVENQAPDADSAPEPEREAGGESEGADVEAPTAESGPTDEAVDEAVDEAADEAVDEAAPSKKAKSKEKAKAKEAEKPTWPPPPPERLEGAVEAILLVAGDVVRLTRLRDLLGLPSTAPIKAAVESVQEKWTAAGLAMELEEVGGGVRAVTRPEFAEYVGRLLKRPASDKLSRTQLETLCIVAYKQPVGRAEVERIRGVQAGEPLRALLERRLLKVVGRSEQPGRPLLYGTTQEFLKAFGLNDVKDLPSAKDLKRL